MFTLRKITKTGVEMNFDLGNHYTLITKERSPEEFEEGVKNYPFYDDTYAFISGKDGEILYLYKDHKNYIVSENGTTYSNLTYK
jgi:hypothetical protein